MDGIDERATVLQAPGNEYPDATQGTGKSLHHLPGED